MGIEADSFDETDPGSYRFDGSTESAIAAIHQRLIKRLTRQYDQETVAAERVARDSRPCVVCSRVSRWQSMARLERYGAAGYRSTTVLGYAHSGPCASAVLSAARDAARLIELDDGRTLADAAGLWVSNLIDEQGPDHLVRFKVSGQGIA